MSVHSIDGYISALVMRSSITVLVEGSGDRKFISRVILELKETGRINSDKIVIDTAEILKSEEALVGNRMLVEHVYEKAVTDCVNNKLFAVVDREFRGFNNTSPVDTVPQHVRVGEGLFWTRGHSIENYFFAPEYFAEFLKHQYSLMMTQAALEAVRNIFPQLLRWACAVGLALRDCNLLKRAERVQKINVWATDGESNISFKPSNYTLNLAARGVTQEVLAELSECIVNYYNFLQQASERRSEQWLTHGHTGWEILWSGVSFVLREFLSEPEDWHQIEAGFNESKINCASDLIARKVAEGCPYALPEFWNQLKESAPAK